MDKGDGGLGNWTVFMDVIFVSSLMKLMKKSENTIYLKIQNPFRIRQTLVGRFTLKTQKEGYRDFETRFLLDFDGEIETEDSFKQMKQIQLKCIQINDLYNVASEPDEKKFGGNKLFDKGNEDETCALVTLRK